MSGDTIRDAREPGFFMIDNELIDDYGPTIGAYGVAVYNVLARYANKHGENAFPSYNHIGEKLGISRDTAIRTVKTMVEQGLIRKIPRTTKLGDPTSNEYVLVNIKGSKPSIGSSSQQPPNGGVVAHSNQGSSCELLPSSPQQPYKDLTKNTKNDKDQSSLAAPVEKATPTANLSDDEINTKMVSETLQKVGIGLTAFYLDQYMDMVQECGIHAVIAGILAAAEQHKQHRMPYVKKCIRSKAEGEQKKPVVSGTAPTPTPAAAPDFRGCTIGDVPTPAPTAEQVADAELERDHQRLQHQLNVGPILYSQNKAKQEELLNNWRNWNANHPTKPVTFPAEWKHLAA